MNAVNCKAVCREIDELDRGQAPSVAAQEHLRSCDYCRKFSNDRLLLRQMVANMETVGAPADFEFRLRARLAAERSQASGFFTRKPTFGLPSVALATLALFIALGFIVQSRWATNTNPNVAVQTVTTNSAEAAVKRNDQNNQIISNSKELANSLNEATGSEDHPLASAPLSAVSGRIKETQKGSRKAFGSNRIAYLKRKNSMAELETAAIFPVEAPESLKVSLDYASGASRTISVPTLSFGSQEIVTRGVSQMSRASAKGVW